MIKGIDIKVARIKLRVTAMDLSKQIGISNVKLSLIENGHIECPEDIYLKIDQILKLSI